MRVCVYERELENNSWPLRFEREKEGDFTTLKTRTLVLTGPHVLQPRGLLVEKEKDDP